MIFEDFYNFLFHISDNKGESLLKIGNPVGVSTLIRQSILKFLKDLEQKRTLLVGALALLTVGYILSPTISLSFQSEKERKQARKKMFLTKRIDKYSTTLRNPRNDCFANSTLQALSSCSSLISYLNIFNKFHQDFIEFYQNSPLKDQMKGDDGIKNLDNLIPLHHELSIYIFKLNTPIVYSNVISVRSFLKVIEKIFNSQISSNQHDAHELLQIILQTLESEYLNLIKVVTLYKEDLTKFTDDHVDDEDVKRKVDGFVDKLIIPSFSFYGHGISQFTCLSCLQKSTLTKYPFSILSLPVPQKRQIELSDLILKNQNETISDYACMNCKIKSILKIEKQREFKKGMNEVLNGVDDSSSNKSAGDESPGSSDDIKTQYLAKLKDMENFCRINDEIEDKDLENFINNYEYEGFKTSNLKSTIIKNHYLIKLPQIMIFHLSRSIFENNFSTKNKCKVKFEKKINLKVNKKIFMDYKMQENVTSLDDEDDSDDEDSSNNNDDDSDDDGVVDDDDDDDDVDSDVVDDDDDDDDDDDEDVDSDSIADDEASDIEPHEKLNELIHTIKNMDIEGSNTNTEAHSRENNFGHLIDFKMKAMVRHTGSHYYGHYECYKKKPMYYKSHHKIINKNPIIDLDNLAINEYSNSEKVDELKNLQEQFVEDNERIDFQYYSSDKSKQINDDVPVVDINGNEAVMSPEINSPKEFDGVAAITVTDYDEKEEEDASDAHTDLGEEDTIPENEIRRGRSRTLSLSFRRGLSRLSRNSGSNTSLSSMGSFSLAPMGSDAQDLSSVDSAKSKSGSFTSSRASSVSRRSTISRKTEHKEVKISSIIKKPFWKLSDSEVTEVTDATVFNDTAAVYMLFYERR
ncbi:putative ubiquitin-specific protease [Saccharomycopsis crataegensis]|uniref:Ubiquitin-specific protease n=1 Tax=Saccharomycopsis crataegensis TaxID=43959 RepID=A0AAV5QV43_9ASCO|nr:putative ubiquitin-specific protease [Saccharomycopsis crataegensis]